MTVVCFLLIVMAATQTLAGTYGNPYLHGERTETDSKYDYPRVYAQNHEEETPESYYDKPNSEVSPASDRPSVLNGNSVKHTRTNVRNEEDSYLKAQRENKPELSHHAGRSSERSHAITLSDNPEERKTDEDINEDFIPRTQRERPEPSYNQPESPPVHEDNSEEASYSQGQAQTANHIGSPNEEGTEKPNHTHKRVEHTVETPPQHVSEVYTRTIVRPVSYSFISANVRPSVHRRTEETTHIISEKREDENIRLPSRQKEEEEAEDEEEDKAEESQQRFSVGDPKVAFHTERLFLGRKTVLPGNLVDLQHKDYEELVPAVKSYAKLGGPSDEHVVLTHSKVSRPIGAHYAGAAAESVSHTRLRNQVGEGDQTTPRREYASSTHHTRSPNGNSAVRQENFHVAVGGEQATPRREYASSTQNTRSPNGNTALREESFRIAVGREPSPSSEYHRGKDLAIPETSLHPPPPIHHSTAKQAPLYPEEYRTQYPTKYTPIINEGNRSNFLEKHSPPQKTHQGKQQKAEQQQGKQAAETKQADIHYVEYFPNKVIVRHPPEDLAKEDIVAASKKDLTESASGHHGGGGGGGGGHKESGGGSEHEQHHDSKKGEKGDKGYKKSSKHDKSKKGHHDQEEHKGEYVDEKGEEKKHHKGEGFYGEHHKQEKGEKASKYGEGKKHKKGHTTHGEHNIVKKDEYIKSTKFYDEDHDGGEEEKHGEYHDHHEEKEGGKKEGEHKKKGYHKEEKGKKGHHDKGHHDEEHSGHEHDSGSEDFYGHEEEYGGKKGGKSYKKWGKE